MAEPLDYATPSRSDETPRRPGELMSWLRATVLALTIIVFGTLLVSAVLALCLRWFGPATASAGWL